MKSVSLRNLVLLINVMQCGRVRMQNVSGVGCDTAEELIIRGAEQVVDGRQIFIAIAKPLAATRDYNRP